MPSEHWMERAFETAPVYALAECMELDILQNRRKFEADAESQEKLMERFRASLAYCDAAQLEFLRGAAEASADRAAFEGDAPDGFWRMYFNDFVYSFMWEDRFYIVFPDELAAAYRQAIAEDDFAAQNQFGQEVKTYAYALLNLYGFYEIDWFAEVWNRHHRDKIDCNRAERLITELSDFDACYYIDGMYVIHDALDDEDFNHLLHEVEFLDYSYMPTKRVIALYGRADEAFFDEIPGTAEIRAFLAEYVTHPTKLINLQDFIAITCNQLESPDDIEGLLETADFPLDNAEAVAKFERLYNKLRNNAHMWDLRGFTPLQYEIETGDSIIPFKLPRPDKDTKAVNERTKRQG